MLLYSIITGFYFFSVRIAAFFNPKAKLMISGRVNWRNELKSKIDKNKSYVWIHCASLGEFEQGRPLIEKIKSENAGASILLTFFSPSGYEIRKNYQFADIVCYLPFDSKANAKDFIDIVKPKYAVFVKYEIWYYFLKELSIRNIPVFLISGIFRKNQIFFKWYGKSYRKALSFFSHLFLQDNKSAELLKNFGFLDYSVCGDTRMDRVMSIAEENYVNPLLEQFSENNNIIVCGSTWEEDEIILCRFINEFSEKYKLIIAPHEINEQHLEKIEKLLKVKSVRLSNLETLDNSVRVIIVDSIGLLSKLYRYAKVAYVGGGFGKGIHNVLEPIVYNIPVIFGPNYKKFKEAVDLISGKTAFEIGDYENFESIINMLFSEQKILIQIKNQTEVYIQKSFGATSKIDEKMQILVKN
ncbi:MAG: glycosyltransferase N-terminal domain-containing protein [Bacteroidales bacterium]|nr:glycosyltransferase N-terminal domain-containing protein [Bacteroidales bacterium]